ncbi:MAG: hypothetical protein F6K58_12940 [Symploca sp. SIO2E9]|nr:hypothetical protein [Symploca sp. SIO2E9]
MAKGRKKGALLTQKELANLNKSSRRQGKRQSVSNSATQKQVSVRLDEQTQQVLDDYAVQFDCYWAGEPSLKRLLEQVGKGKLLIVSAEKIQ